MMVTALAVAALLVLAGLALTAVGGGRGIGAGTVLVLDPGADLPESRRWSAGWFGPRQPDWWDALAALEAAADDDRVEGLLLKGGGASLGWGRVQELRDAVARFAASGKPVRAYVEMPGLREYVLATAADRIRVHPRGRLMLAGAPLEVMFYGELLEKVGIGAQFEAVGMFKNAPDGWTRSEMSEPHREQLTELAGEVLELATGAVAGARGMAPDQARELLTGGPILASDALRLGLVDAIGYPGEVEEEWEGPELVALTDYAAAFRARGGRRQIAVVHVDGLIVPGESMQDVVAGRVAGADTVRRALERVRRSERVEAVVLRIASPGGVDTAADTIWRAAHRVRERMPVVASFGDVAASGGYWVATGASHVVASPASITGSIGVFAGKFHLEGLLERLGIAVETVFAEGSAPNNWSSLDRELSAGERERLRAGVEDTYAVFLERVAAARGMITEEVDRVAQGRIWSGRRALEMGLVDELGGLDAAVRRARAEAGIPAGEAVEILRLPEPPDFAEVLLAQLGGLPGTRTPMVRALLEGGWFALLPVTLQPGF